MAFDFPSPASEGAVYAPAGGPQYTFSNGAWRMIGAPSPLVATADSYNRVVNGAMQHSQENGNTSGSTNAYFAADQWALGVSGITSSFLRIPSGGYFHVGSTITQKVSLAASDYVTYYQSIEGNRIADFEWGTATAKQVVLRFDAQVSVAGTYAVCVRNGGGGRSWVGTFTAPAGGWNTYTFIIPGDTAGTWPTDNTKGVDIFICWACGTANSAPALGWNAGTYLGAPGMSNGAATTQSVYLRRVGLYADPNNTGVAPPWVTPDYASELAACLRYWQQFYAIITTSTLYPSNNLLVPMRVAPAITGGGAGYTVNNTNPFTFSVSQTARASATIVANARM